MSQKITVPSEKQQEFDENFTSDELETTLRKKGLGYVTDGEPTDAQVQLQDHIDNEIFRFLGTMRGIYLDAADQEHEDMEWDIGKVSEIRTKVESLLQLPEVY